MAEKPRNLIFGPFRLEPANAQLWRGSERITLAPKPFDVLCHLAARAGNLVTKDELLEAIWPNLHISESSLSVAMNALRGALQDDPKTPQFIETVTRRGYRFIAPVSVAQPHGAGWQNGESPPARPGAESPQPNFFVGRESPIEELERLFERSLAGKRQLVFVTGEAGIGKTTLVQMFLERVAGRGIPVLLGRCVEHFGTDEAFHPLVEALQERRADVPLLMQMLREYAPTWMVQLPGLLEEDELAELRKEVFGASRERMLREFCDFLEALASRGPLVFVVEDLHWSDFATLDVLSRFARGTRNASLLIIATYRPSDVRIENHPTWKLRLDLQRHGLCAELPVQRLSQSEAEEYLRLRFADERIARELGPPLFARSEGQPLFLVSLVDDLITRRSIVEDDGRWRLAFRAEDAQSCLPVGLREMIEAQIDRLGEEEQRVLETASVDGVEFSAAMLAGPASEEICRVEQICEILARRGMMLRAAGAAEWPNGTIAGRYSFLHGLYQQILYQRLAPGQRAQLHRCLAERLEQGYGDKATDIAAVLACHFEQGREFPKAINYLRAAATNSSQRFSNGEAAAYLRRALNLVNRLPADERLAEKINLLRRLAWVKRSGGDFTGSIKELEAMVSCAAEASDLRSEINGLLDLSRFCLYSDRLQSLQFAERALAKSQDLEDDVLKALVQGSSANINLMLRGWRDEDADLCREVVKTTADAVDPWILLRRRSLDTVTNYLRSNYCESCAAARDGMTLAQALGDQYYFILFNTIFGFALLHLGEWRELRQMVLAALEMTKKNANTQGSVLCHLTLGWLHAEALDFEGAKNYCAEVFDPDVVTNPFAYYIGRNLMAKACLGLRDYAGALAQFEEMQRRVEADGIGMDSTIYPHFQSNLCQYWLEIGDLARAQEEAARLYEISVVPPERTYLALTHRLLAKIAMAAKKFDEARAHVLRAVAIVEQADLPLAAWRVYATAASLHEDAGEPAQAAALRHLSRQIIDRLCESLGEDKHLREKLLAGYCAEALR
ncbi:MAG: AAA family ATPase [Methylocapsa sp.]|nr:AAA family ATPase [Methylocapsa sp.]